MMSGTAPIGAALRALSVLLAACLACARPALAHSVHIFAWADGPRLCSESYFSGKSRVIGGEVILYGAGGRELARGRTDRQGLFCAPAPSGADVSESGGLRFVVLAGQGHRAEYVLPAAEARQAASPGGPAAAPPEPAFPASAPLPGPNIGPNIGPDIGPDIGEETRLRALFREELDSRLGPLLRALAEQRAADEPGMLEIVGGIGWLLGLAAVIDRIRRRRSGC
jgi:nickel transport protein